METEDGEQRCCVEEVDSETEAQEQREGERKRETEKISAHSHSYKHQASQCACAEREAETAHLDVTRGSVEENTRVETEQEQNNQINTSPAIRN